MLERPTPVHVVLWQPEIAANTGSIGRTCVAAGATLWLVRPLGFHLDDKSRRRAGLDYWNHLDCRLVDSLDEAASHIGPERLWYFSTRARTAFTQVQYAPGDALVFGPESRGLPEHLVRTDRALRIPTRPEARSLNLAVAVGIAVYEALRHVHPGAS